MIFDYFSFVKIFFATEGTEGHREDREKDKDKNKMLEGQETDLITEKIIGAAIEVHRELGQGLLESVYEEALCHEFDLQGIEYIRQAPTDIYYKNKKIKGFKVDLLVENEVVVELKAVTISVSSVVSQTISYLKATNLRRGLIINFNNRRLIDGVKRVSN